MEAGRELDALIAEKVMGWERREIILAKNTAFGQATWKEMAIVKGDNFQTLNPENQPYNIKGAPNYSTNIAAAWDVVEALRVRGITGHFTTCAYPSLWRADFRLHAEANSVGCVTSDISAPHAICLAALRAVEGK